MERLTKYDNNAKCYLPFSLTDWSEIKIMNKLGELEDVLEKYEIENAEELDKFIYHKDCQIEKWKQYYENCSKLEKSMSKEHQYCLDNWRACEQELAELARKYELSSLPMGGLVDEARKLEQELAELKQKAIVPKFRTYQPIFYITQFYTSTKGNPEYDIISDKYYVAENENEIILGWNYAKDFNQRKYYYVRKDWVFATKEEAEQKLAEIKGEKNE